MSSVPPATNTDLAAKIARLVEERGWNQEDFARITTLNRHTVRQILLGHGRRPRNATVQACARALGLTVSELRALPLERLLPRMQGHTDVTADDRVKRLLDQATRPELLAWVQRNGERASQLTPAEIEELLTMQSDGGILAALGVERVIELMERKRELIRQVHVVAGSEYLGLLEQFVRILHDRVQG